MTREEMVEINDISLAIGELRSDAKNTRDAVLRIERNVERITGSLNTLPPSPVCLVKHDEIEKRLTELRVENMKHATIISGLIAGLLLFGKNLLQAFGFIPHPPN